MKCPLYRTIFLNKVFKKTKRHKLPVAFPFSIKKNFDFKPIFRNFAAY